MATLTGQSIASSYEQLIHTDTDGGGNGTTLVPIKDGDNGTTFSLELATTSIAIGATHKLYLDGGGNTYITESSADTIQLATGGSARVTINDTAIGVNTDSPTANSLELASKRIKLSGTGSGWGAGEIGMNSNQLLMLGGSSGIHINPDPNGIDANGFTLTDKTITSSSTSSKIVISGIQFDSSGETLGDYEEGTWTPIVKDSQSTPNSATMSSGATGFFTRIGNMCHVSFACEVAGVSGMTGTDGVTIHGLPFTVDTGQMGGGEPHAGIMTFMNNLSNVDYNGLIMARANNNTTHIELKYTVGGSQTIIGGSSLLVNQLGTTYMSGSVSFKIE